MGDPLPSKHFSAKYTQQDIDCAEQEAVVDSCGFGIPGSKTSTSSALKCLSGHMSSFTNFILLPMLYAGFFCSFFPADASKIPNSEVVNQ